MVKISFLGAARTVTGSMFLVETAHSRFVVDCGLFQGSKALKERNYQDFVVDPGSVDFMVLTHAHIDHSGLIPKFCLHGFKGPIYCHHATAELCAVMLPDSGYIQESEVERKNRKLDRAGKPLLEPIYTAQDALDSLKQFEPLDYGVDIALGADVRLRLQDAGHILGSAIAELWIAEAGTETKIVFSGDIGQGSQPIIKDPSIIDGADYVVLESTYGDRFHDEIKPRTEQLQQIIVETMKKGGNLIVPAFAVERTQDILYDLNILASTERLDPGIDIYIDSPLAIAATEIFRRNVEYYDEETKGFVAQGQHPLEMRQLKYSHTQEESVLLNQRKGGAIIISASGMCDAGRIKHHLKHNLWRPESTIMFVGYQAEGTLGRRLLEGAEQVTIHGEEVAVKADIRRIEAFSAHGDQGDLLDWIVQMERPPRQVILVHGEEQAQAALAEVITARTGIPVIIPEWLDEMTLEAAVAGEMQTTAAFAEQRSALEHSVMAEEAYMSLRSDLHRLYDHASRSGNYGSLLGVIEKVRKILREV